ncbi:copper homeostasis protein CutC [Chthonobacter albigriseus]|uniref:copper homeostasis protein CutC n=1 Tax=Chthonobacter albigriseus TaxID=1683161 RepID=UPI0015EF20FC|nr:copper homeostasis protein CutC [Chthonobacter albigriseus]
MLHPAERVLLEVCVEDADGLEAAIAGGADRIELCSALALGGLTPSPGLMRLAASAPIPVMAMIRPRSGDFQVDAATLDIMKGDIDAAREAGLAGVVFGASLADGRLDAETLATLVAHAEGLDLTLHRAFDLVPDLREALEVAIGVGFARVLTSGGASTAPEAGAVLAKLVEHARGRIVVMPGSGVRAENAGALVRATGAVEVHASCSVAAPVDARLLGFGFTAPSQRRTSRAAVAALRAALDGLT